MSLHIGLVGPLPPPFGGMANQTGLLAELLRSEGEDVSFIQTNADYRPLWVGRIPWVRAFFRLISYIFSLRRRVSRCDIVHIMANSGWSWHLFATPAIWLAKIYGKPVVVNYHGGEAEKFLSGSHKIINLSMRQAASLIVPSGFLKAVFERFGISATVIPNIIDIHRFNTHSTHRTIRRHILVARNLEYIYDNETAIRAFAIVNRAYPDATLTIAGSGPLATSLSILVESLGLTSVVKFTGKLDRDDMAQAYGCADIALNPSLVDNMPVSILEALASGVPVVTTSVGGIPFIVEHEHTALLVPPKSPGEMADAILRLMRDSVLAEKLASNGRSDVEKYTWEQVWPALKLVYCSLIPVDCQMEC